MAKFISKNTVILGCSVVLGENECLFDAQPEYYNNSDALRDRLKKMIGFGVRYTAKEGTTTSDLCGQAAQNLLRSLDIDPAELGGIISVTQTPDYYMPGNAHVLHKNLGLTKESFALDIEMGCSGYIYGIWLASLMLSASIPSDRRKVLLLAGDTLSKAVNKQDRASAPLFGDAGSATLLEFSEGSQEMRFVLRADGTGLEKMYMPAGAYRLPSSDKTRCEIDIPDGGKRSNEDIYLDGFGIFDFTMTEQPALLADILDFSGKTIAEIDYFLLHQANRYIVETITQKTGIPASKAPSDTFERFGNQNSASIPGVLCGSLASVVEGKKMQVVMQGFGIGLSWGACQMELDNILCLPPTRYTE